jgi:signal transduction histidine kinase
MVKKFFDKIANRTRIGFLAAFLLLVVSYILTYISTQKVIVQDYWMNHTNEVIHNLDNLLGHTIKGESAFRGYIISRNPKLLDQFGQSEIDTYNSFRVLKKLTVDNQEQQTHLDTLHQLIDQKFLWIRGYIPAFTSNTKGVTFSKKMDQEGIVFGKQLENYITKMQSAEKALWNQRSKKVSEYSDFIRILNIISIIVAIVLTLFSIIVYNKEYRAKRKADKKASEFREQLEHRVKELADLNEELIDLRSLEKYAVTGRIARTMAHEVRNPLTNINLATEQLQAELEPNETTDLLFKMITRNSERINQLVSDLLNTTRVADLTFTETTINQVLDESVELAKDRIELNNIKVVKNYTPETCVISLDTAKMKIAFLNIIVNAIEAMNTEGILTLETVQKNNRCVIKISDNGIGMSKEQVGRLFEPYFTTKEKGNGLGLANSQNIILGHNGTISAESAQSKGTTFTISLQFPKE